MLGPKHSYKQAKQDCFLNNLAIRCSRLLTLTTGEGKEIETYDRKNASRLSFVLFLLSPPFLIAPSDSLTKT